jgi:hypothetical protein
VTDVGDMRDIGDAKRLTLLASLIHECRTAARRHNLEVRIRDQRRRLGLLRPHTRGRASPDRGGDLGERPDAGRASVGCRPDGWFWLCCGLLMTML